MRFTKEEFLEKLLKNFAAYYNINTETPTFPFDVECSFVSHDVNYLLIKIAKISESDASEFLYIKLLENLDERELVTLEEAAWKAGMAKLQVGPGHHETDVTLIILADHVDPQAAAKIKKLNRNVSYKWGLWGFSHNRLVALELSTERCTYNRQGETLKKLFSNILGSI